VCVVDGKRHCTTHLQKVGDHLDGAACDAHRSVCHVDRAQFTRAGTTACPSCGRLACRGHLRPCSNCGRRVCVGDFKPERPETCATCSTLATTSEPSDEVIAAAIGLRGHDAQQPRRWRVARDARHRVVELDLGWTRRLVFAVPHGQSDAETALSHSILGSRRLRG
jgi:hypothetical protein